MRIVMCRPDYFDVTYTLSTNRWMNPNIRPDLNLARRQWENLYENYKKHGVKVSVMCGQPYLSDMVFVANAGLPIRSYFIITNFFHEKRQREVPFLKTFFERRGRLINLKDSITFEGQGDALFIDQQTLLVGCGIRTSKYVVDALSDVAKMIGRPIEVIMLPFRKISDYQENELIFYHLDTCLLYLSKIQTFLVYPRAFQEGTISVLREFGDIVELTRAEAESFACNSVVYHDVIFTPQIGRGRMYNFLTDSGYTVMEHDMSEFIKSGGAVKCLSLEMWD